MRLRRRTLLATTATTVAASTGLPAVSGTAVAQATAATDWQASRDTEAQAALRAVAADGDGDGYLGVGLTLSDEDRVWLLPVDGDGTAGQVRTLDGLADSVVADAMAADGRWLVAGTRVPAATPRRPWVVALDGDRRVWSYRPEFEDRDDRWLSALVADEDGVTAVGWQSPPVTADRPRRAVLTQLVDGERRSRTAVGGGQGGLEDSLVVTDAAPTGDGGVLLTGRAGTLDDSAAWIGAADADGLRWGRRIETVGGTATGRATACQPVGDGYLIGLFTAPSPTEARPHVLRVGPEGETRWRYDAAGRGWPVGFAVTGEGIVTGGTPPSVDATAQFWLAWLDGDGSERWAETYRESGGVYDLTADGDGAVVAGDRDDDPDLRRLSLSVGGSTTATDTDTDTDTDTGSTATGDDGDGDETTADGGGGGEDAGTGDPRDDTAVDGAGGLPLPGFGPGAAVAGGALGVGAWLRRRGRDQDDAD